MTGQPSSDPADKYPPGAHEHILVREMFTPWTIRVVAALIDIVPMLLLTAIGIAFAVGTGDNVCQSRSTAYGEGLSCTSTWTPAGVALFTLLDLAALAFVIWNYGYRQGTTGSSIGKSVMKFQVVSEKNWQPIGFGMSLVRQLAHVLDTLICYVGYLFPLWDAKRQTIADKIMKTVCIPSSPDA